MSIPLNKENNKNIEDEKENEKKETKIKTEPKINDDEKHICVGFDLGTSTAVGTIVTTKTKKIKLFPIHKWKSGLSKEPTIIGIDEEVDKNEIIFGSNALNLSSSQQLRETKRVIGKKLCYLFIL